MYDYSRLLLLHCTAELILSYHNLALSPYHIPLTPFPSTRSFTPLGLTVFRDQWFSSDVTGEAVKRIEGDKNILWLNLFIKSIII